MQQGPMALPFLLVPAVIRPVITGLVGGSIITGLEAGLVGESIGAILSPNFRLSNPDTSP